MKTNAAFWIPVPSFIFACGWVRAKLFGNSGANGPGGCLVGTSIEISRLNQERLIDSKGLQFALVRLEAMRRKWAEIVPSEKVRDIAETLPDSYGLRALDSFQLAAALVWCNERPNGRLFICDDVKLSVAAQKAGFSIEP